MRNKTPKNIIYRGTWQGLGKIYDIRVENGYTTIIVRPGEDLKERSRATKEKFANETGS
jgi:hypothetical protein